MKNKNLRKIEDFINSSGTLCFLEQSGEIDKLPYRLSSETLNFFIPLCPDYSFELNDNNERIHDFSGMEEGRGIVYEKLIKNVQPFFDFLNKNNIDYYATFLMADVENMDRLILKKLGITKEEFMKKCNQSVKKISENLKLRKIKGECLGMVEFFTEHNYNFHKKEDDNIEKIKRMEIDKAFLDKVTELRKDLYKFWFSISDDECVYRAKKDIGMYAAFAEQKDISSGIILCADSEILSCSYNSLKKTDFTPVIYVKGTY